jgi:hypothetical protein
VQLVECWQHWRGVGPDAGQQLYQLVSLIIFPLRCSESSVGNTGEELALMRGSSYNQPLSPTAALPESDSVLGKNNQLNPNISLKPSVTG